MNQNTTPPLTAALTVDHRNKYYAGVRPELARFIPKTHRKVLEIGCGRGGFRAYLSLDAEVWGVEPVAIESAEAVKRLDRVLTGTFEHVAEQLPDAYFDLVICNDVIEHMADDRAFLVAIQSKMTSDGLLIGSIPNMRFWPVLRALIFGKDWTYVSQGVLDRTHLRFYTIKSFPLLLQSTGYEVLHFEGINQNLRRRTRRLLRLIGQTDAISMQFAFTARKAE